MFTSIAIWIGAIALGITIAVIIGAIFLGIVIGVVKLWGMIPDPPRGGWEAKLKVLGLIGFALYLAAVFILVGAVIGGASLETVFGYDEISKVFED